MIAIQIVIRFSEVMLISTGWRHPIIGIQNDVNRPWKNSEKGGR